MASPDLLIVGGSARAAAWCAVRAGLKVAALDRYNDLDLLAVADPCFLWDGSDRQVEEVVGTLGVPWMYVGPLENRPDLIDRCAQLAPLRGNDGAVLRRVRDPLRVQAVLREAGFPTLEVREEHEPPPPDGTWLLKPRHGCGGRGIAFWDERAAGHPTLREPHYFQEFIHAGPRTFRHNIVFESSNQSSVRLLGRFHGGNHGPDTFGLRFTEGPLPTRERRFPGALPGFMEREWAIAVAAAFGLKGLCGIDFAQGWRGGHIAAAVEINPRFTWSMELCEAESGAFAAGDCGGVFPRMERAKEVVFADIDVRVGRLPVFGPSDGGWLADVPAPGTVFRRGEPICTVFAAEPRRERQWDSDELGRRADRLHDELRRRVDEVRRHLSPA